jgi:radical SAM protein with 4Fe4S-binding SPASM domain
MRYRLESFGGIVASDDPPFLAFVDRQYLRERGVPEAAVWRDDAGPGRLQAPVEVHFACTNRCSLGCSHCYMDSGVEDAATLDTAAFCAMLDALARMGVFHVALGGGEALEREDLFELAAHARRVGLVPNLTTNGRRVTPALAERMRVFGQVNLSLDGVGAAARTFRDGADFDSVDRAFGMLQAAGVSAGINCVVGRRNLDALPELFQYAAARAVSEIELLRFKPSGRARAHYDAHRATPEQNRGLYPLFTHLSETSGVKAKIDCSFLPMLCYHRPPPQLLEALCVCGCEAGNFLLGARSDGRVCGCSFLPPLDLRLAQLPEAWGSDPGLQRCREWGRMRAEPCASCEYLRHCKGGCHAVALAVTGDMDAPDPDCPWVVEHTASRDNGAKGRGHP